MTWFGTVSAWGAVVVGLALIGLSAMNFRADVTILAMSAIGALLLLGGARTLRKLSGGLRLLAGAWGLAGGFMVLPFAQSGSLRSFYLDLGSAAYGITGGAIACLIGLALTVLHKEKK